MAIASNERIQICGWGAVSPGGWGVAALELDMPSTLAEAPSPLIKPGVNVAHKIRPVPKPNAPPAFLRHPRLRRSSPISHYAMAAALEAVGPEAASIQKGDLRLGLIVCTLSGSVNYSTRFYDELQVDPALASPVLFPETVFNAPASHVASSMQGTTLDCTLVGDVTVFLEGLRLAERWLRRDWADRCLVIGAEEKDWITADGLCRFSRSLTPSEGAGAVYLKQASADANHAALGGITDAFSFTNRAERIQATRHVRGQLEAEPQSARTILCTRQQGVPWFDQAEERVWRKWDGERICPIRRLGEGFTAATAWQVIAALLRLQRGPERSAWISVTGLSHQCMGLRLEK